MNSKIKVKEGIGDLRDENGETVSLDEEKASVLNKFFCDVFTVEKTDDIPTCEKRNKDVNLEGVDFTRDKVLKKLQNINPSKSGGPDGISA